MSALPQPGQRWLDRYEIRDELGRGGFGRVYLADDQRLDREVAIKVLRQSEDLTDTDYQRFRREINIAARLTHPAVVTVYDGGDHDGLSYLVMRYVEGHDLRRELRAGPLPTARLASVIDQIAGALDYAHGLGLVHRDVKPGNILCEDGADRVYLADFGISRPVEQSTEDQLTQAGLGPATFYYAAPEQLRTGQRVDARTDVYALGCVLYECLTGDRPFEGKIGAVIGAHLQQPPPLVSAARPDLSQRWDALVAKAMAKAPEDRYHRCGDLADAIAELSPAGTRASYADERALAHAVAQRSTARPASWPADTPRAGAPPPPRPATAHLEQAATDDPVAPHDAAPSRAPMRTTERPPARPPRRHRPSPRRARATFALLGLVLAALAGWLFWPDGDDGGEREVAAEQRADAQDAEQQGADGAALDDAQTALLETVGVFSPDDCRSPQRRQIEGARTAVSCSDAEQTPTRVVFRAFDDEAARDAAFDQQSAGRRTTADCRADHDARHAYRNGDGDGQVYCLVSGGIAGITWTLPGQPIMGSARLDGAETIAELYAWWDEVVGRDAADRLPSCPEDPGLVERGALAAVQCRLTGGLATVASNAQFASVAEMDAWYDAVAGDARTRRLQEVRGGADPGICMGLGRDAARLIGGETRWAIEGGQGRLLCFTNENDLNALFWTDETTAVGSVAVSPAADGLLEQLVEEWTRSPYRVAD